MTSNKRKNREKKLAERIIDFLRQKASELESKHFTRISRYYQKKAELLQKNLNSSA